MSEDYDYTPATHWKGHDFTDARKSYDKHAGRSYSDAKEERKTCKDLIPKSIVSKSSAQLLINCDVTGSMEEWPAVMFSKLPYLEYEAKEYLGQDLEILFGANGDANSDDYPVQIRPFAKDAALKDRLEELVIEGNGGGQKMETYELNALYYARKVEMPNAIRKPILIFIGDESPYSYVDEDYAKDILGIILPDRLTTAQLFEELKEKYAVYLISKKYEKTSGDEVNEINNRIYNDWVKLLGSDHIAILPKAERVVDVIFAILAQETDRVGYFRKEIEGRQKTEQVDMVYKSVESIHRALSSDVKKNDFGKSITKIGSGAKAKRLLE